MNDGQNLVNHCDHASTSYIGTGDGGLSGSEAQNFTNGTKYCNFYTLGCYAGNYPSTCWGEYLVRDDQGGISYVGNTRYGWYYQGNAKLWSGHYDKLWWKALYKPDYNAYRAGETLALSLNDYFPADDLYKYIWTELNLLGDPALHLWTKDPSNLTVTHAPATGMGQQNFSVNVKDGSTDVEGALVCLMKGAEVYAFGTTDGAGEVSLAIEPVTKGDMTVTVTAQNFRHYEGTVSVQEGSFPPTITSITPRCGMESGGTAVTVTGSQFTTDPATTVKIGGNDLSSLVVVDPGTITGFSPQGTNGWEDVEVSNSIGSDTLTEGFRYFPTGGLPFNGTDIHTESLDAPAVATVIASGLPNHSCTGFFSYGGGATPTPYGTMGLTFPIYYLFSLNHNNDGFTLVPLELSQGFGPLDFYIHILGLDSGSNPIWSYGGNNPNGSGSIWIHVNN
jgi:hypothetical protein